MDLNLSGEKRMPLYEFAAVIILFAIYLLPSVSIGSTILMLLLFAYCAYLVLFDSKMLWTVAKPLLLIFALAFFYALLSDANSIAQNVSNRELKRFISKVYQYLTLYFPAILFVRVNRVASQKQKKYLAIAGILIMIYVVISTWIFLIENPDATRQWANFEETSTQDVANYYFIYAVPIIISVLSIAMLRARGAYKILYCCLIVAGMLFLVDAQYTLAILIAIIGVLIQLYRNFRSPITKVVFVIAIIAGIFYLPQILELAIRVIDSRQVTVRLSEIHAFLTGKGAGGYNLNGRLTLYSKTIEAFFDSPIWGNRKLNFDGHSTFLTVLADTGILGGLPFFALLVMICKSIKEQVAESASQFDVIIIMFVMMGLTNPIHASLPLGLVTWFLAPLTIQMLLKEESKIETALEN